MMLVMMMMMRSIKTSQRGASSASASATQNGRRQLGEPHKKKTEKGISGLISALEPRNRPWKAKKKRIIVRIRRSLIGRSKKPLLTTGPPEGVLGDFPSQDGTRENQGWREETKTKRKKKKKKKRMEGRRQDKARR